MANILLVIHVLVAITIVVLVLLQQGRGADMGAAFGGGAQTLFGSRGSSTFLSRITTWLAAVFFLTSLGLAYVYTGLTESRSVIEEPAPQSQSQSQSQPAPAQPDQEIPPAPAPALQESQGEIPPVPGASDEKAGSGTGDAPKSQ